jgi:hypothetical protein
MHKMDLAIIEEAIKTNEIYVDDPKFYAKAFTFACQTRKALYARDGDNFKRVITEEYDAISRRIDATPIQDSCSVRNVLRTRRLANLLINDKGELNLTVLPRLIDLLKENFYSLGPNRQFDAKRQKHLLNVLTILNENKDIQRTIKGINKPASNRNAEQMIRDTLLLPANTTVTDAHARRACLSAWMCLLRQNVGSCFATAPAIIVQAEQPEVFFKDLLELINTGRLTRTFGGVENSVPLSPTWGAGDLKKPFLLPTGEGFKNSLLWSSPGLISAFEAAGQVDLEASAKEKYEKVKTLLAGALEMLNAANQPYILTSAEELIRKALLKNLNLTEEAVTEFQNRPQEMMSPNLMIAPAAAAQEGIGSKRQLCSTFLTQLDQAEAAFKGLGTNALLKAWEFSLASFSEMKAQFTRWNLYSSLGLGANEAGGIGACLYGILSEKLEQANRKMEEFQVEYETAYLQIKAMESHVRNLSSEKEARWLQAEYQSKRNESFSLEEMRDRLHNRAQRLANLFDPLIKQYYDFFTRYFQEIYDADMHDVTTGPFDDSPAGFRLLYKHGRSNTSLWTLIKTPNQFIDALASFFNAVELELVAMEEFQKEEKDILEMTTAIVNHVRTTEFLESAFYRMAAAHKTPAIKNPLEHLDRIDKKPWAYTSGGGMDTLITTYFKLNNPPDIAYRWVDNPTELLVFIIDTIKLIPPKITEEFINSSKSMLMESPTHAFLLKPGDNILQNSWKNDVFTYTWVRDQLILPRKKMIENIELDEQMMHYLVQKLMQKIPENYQHYFSKVFGNFYGTMSPSGFRNHLILGMSKERGLKIGRGTVLSDDEIDSMLFKMLPLFNRTELRERLENLYAAIPAITKEKRDELMAVFDLCYRYSLESVVDAAAFQDIAKGVWCLTTGETTSNVDLHAIIAEAAQQLGYALPPPILFADTNWAKEDFGFVVNPGNNELELWRCDYLGREGNPMSSWREWLNGSRKDIKWGIYTKPYQYRF